MRRIAVARLSLFVVACLLMQCCLVAVPFRSSASASLTDLYFSEYVEGSGNNKALEIYNGTGADVDLGAADYNIRMFFNGSTSSALTIRLTGTIAPGAVYVVAHASADSLATKVRISSLGLTLVSAAPFLLSAHVLCLGILTLCATAPVRR
jgi:predicted extracellular nuclease